MNRNKLKTYAPEARRDFIRAVTDRASYYGLTATKTEPVTIQGDIAIISGRAFPKKLADQRKRLEDRIKRHGFDQVMEAMAYTWFNRLVAIRFMELHGYLDHGYRVLSSGQYAGGRAQETSVDRRPPTAHSVPEIVEHAEHLDLPGLDKQKVISLKLDGTKESELYRMLLIAQCNALHKAMPFLFEHIDDETELLLPDNLLHSDSLIRTLVKEIPEEDWQEVEIIGWLYQFYISEKKEEVIGKVVKSEDIPAATQLFTPNWIVKYLVHNSLGRQWMATYPNSPLKAQMEYYIEPAEQTPEVQEQLKAITPENLNPEELTLLDPACGSGHILVEAYDLLKAIYQERGYRAKDIPRLILEKNLHGLDIDDRAAQLAAFALMMKARADDRRIFDSGVQLHVLAIQESKSLNAREVTEALNQPIFKGEAPPPESLFEELDDDKSPLFSRKNLAATGGIAQADIAHLIGLFEHGKTFGSLIHVPGKLAEKLPAITQRAEDVLAYGGMFEQASARALTPLIQQAGILAGRYDAVVANPPYMGGKYLPGFFKDLVRHDYPDSKSDLFSIFIERNLDFTKAAGHVAMITMHSWMFLSSFESLRSRLLATKTLETLAHFGPRAFASISGEVVQTAAFVWRKTALSKYAGAFFRLLDGEEEQKKEALGKKLSRFNATVNDFLSIPGTPVAYWCSDAVRSVFKRGTPLGRMAAPRKGNTTTDNGRFLRFWAEVDITRIGMGQTSLEATKVPGYKWIPYNKGGGYRRWYGFNEFVVNWENNGAEIKAIPHSVIANEQYFLRPGLTWSTVASKRFSVREFNEGFIFDNGGCCIFDLGSRREYIAAVLNSRVFEKLFADINPTLNYQSGDVAKFPVLLTDGTNVESNARKCIEIYRKDWDLLETSWDYQGSPLIGNGTSTVVQAVAQHDAERQAAFDNVRACEEENNRIIAALYGLENEIECEVPLESITLDRPDVEEEMKRLISYAIGCMMGRYSLDKRGLIYGQSGGRNFDSGQYKTFPADEDGIIPLTELEWFEGDAAGRFEKFIATVWPKQHLDENLKFLASSLGLSRGERPRETIRRYLATGFYKHHLSMYKKRPIYWLFSSGKQRAFQCLVYLHRYNEGTLARMRTEYVIPLSGKMATRIDQLAGDIAAASSTSHRRKLEKEREMLVKQREELQSFDEQLRHYADQRIKLGLNDGVKVNYGKFGNLLAEVKAITGGSSDD
jgi:type II restriction/modification system DNA methylase subunit YeeA